MPFCRNFYASSYVTNYTNGSKSSKERVKYHECRDSNEQIASTRISILYHWIQIHILKYDASFDKEVACRLEILLKHLFYRVQNL